MIICFIIYIKYFFRSEVSLENEIAYNLMLFYLHNKSLFVLMTVICNENVLVFFLSQRNVEFKNAINV